MEKVNESPYRMLWVWTEEGSVFEAKAYDRQSHGTGLWFIPMGGGTLTYAIHAFETEEEAIEAALAHFRTKQIDLNRQVAKLRTRLTTIWDKRG